MRTASGKAACAFAAVLAWAMGCGWGIEIAQEDGAWCDPLAVAAGIGEVGFGVEAGGVFAKRWSLDSLYLGTGDPVCAETNDPFLADEVVAILNTSERAFSGVWYVGDAGTSLSNWDGKVGEAGGAAEQLAFRIDAEGVNRPLIFESLTADGVWEPGEVWHFVVQDFHHESGTEVEMLGSVGLGSGGGESSGSVLALPALEPGPPVVEPRLEWAGATPQIRFGTETGFSYSVRRSPDLVVWSELALVDGDGAEAVVEDADPELGARWFYQVVTSSD